MRNLIASAVLIQMSLLGIFGCASKPIDQAEVRKSSEAYEQMRKALQLGDRVAPGNTLSVDFPADTKVTGEYKVDFEGNIQMPYKITLKVGGQTIRELKESIQKAYQPFVKGKPALGIEIKERSVWVEVRGEVKNAGRYLVRLDTSIEEIVTIAGGFAGEQAGGAGASRSSGRPDYLRIDRMNADSSDKDSIWFELAEYFSQYDTEPDLLWRGGESIFFQKTAPADANVKKSWHNVTVMGEVRDPKEHPVLPNADLLTYVSRSGGPTTAADLSRVEIIHRNSDKRRTVNMVKDRMTNELKEGDVVVVRAIDNSPPFISTILTTVLAVTSISMSIIMGMILTGMI